MTDAEREKWDQKYRTGDVHLPTEPTPLLRRLVDDLPDGRALDVATGLGRNAAFLAEHGYAVDALDISREGLARARAKWDERDHTGSVEWIQADVDRYAFPPSTYAVAVVSYYRNLDRLDELFEALVPGGVLVYEHPVRPPNASDDSFEYALEANELLDACRDRTVLYYEETWLGDNEKPTATVVARRDDE